MRKMCSLCLENFSIDHNLSLFISNTEGNEKVHNVIIIILYTIFYKKIYYLKVFEQRKSLRVSSFQKFTHLYDLPLSPTL